MSMIVYGECVGSRASSCVRISHLADRGCDCELDGSSQSPAPDCASTISDGSCSLWIGAVGPISATAIRRDAAHFALQFDQPLSDKILNHFRA